MFMLYSPICLLLSMPGLTECLVIAGVALLFFGGRKIPELMRGLGRGIREFNDAKNNLKTELENGIKSKEHHNDKDVDKK